LKKQSLTFYDEINTYIDNSTGEVVSTTKKTVSRRENTPEFTMLFIQGLSLLTKSNLSPAQAKVLFELLKYTVSNSNMLLINKSIKDRIAEYSDLAFRTVEQAIQQLIKKEIVIKKESMFILNPVIFGRGNFQNVKKLRQSLEIEYDFENETALELATVKTLYNDEQDMKRLKVTDYKETREGNNLEQEIILEAENPNQKIMNFEDEVNSDSNEIELLNAKNKAKELAIEEMKLKLEMHNKGLL